MPFMTGWYALLQSLLEALLVWNSETFLTTCTNSCRGAILLNKQSKLNISLTKASWAKIKHTGYDITRKPRFIHHVLTSGRILLEKQKQTNRLLTEDGKNPFEKSGLKPGMIDPMSCCGYEKFRDVGPISLFCSFKINHI